MTYYLRWLQSGFATACALALALLAPAHAADHDLQAWLSVATNLKFSRTITANVEFQERFTDDLGRASQLQAKASLHYILNPSIRLGAGYSHTWLNRAGAPDDEENRLWQELHWKPGRMAGAGVTLKTRLEECFFDSSDEVAWRLRQQVKLKWPVRIGPVGYVYSSEELFFTLNDTDGGAQSGFDKARLSVGFGAGVSKAVSVEAGYLNQFQPRPAADDRVSHAMMLTVTIAP